MIMRYVWVVVALGLTFSHWWVWNHRGEVEQAKQLKAVNEFREKEAKLVSDLETAKKRREVILRDRLQVITQVIGKCLDDPIPDELLNGLRNDSPNSEAKPGPHS